MNMGVAERGVFVEGIRNKMKLQLAGKGFVVVLFGRRSATQQYKEGSQHNSI